MVKDEELGEQILETFWGKEIIVEIVDSLRNW